MLVERTPTGFVRQIFPDREAAFAARAVAERRDLPALRWCGVFDGPDLETLERVHWQIAEAGASEQGRASGARGQSGHQTSGEG